MSDQPVPDEGLHEALALFQFPSLPTLEQLEARRRELLATWQPARFANLTNNPQKYMQAYTKAEAMTRQINDAYRLLAAWLAASKS